MKNAISKENFLSVLEGFWLIYRDSATSTQEVSLIRSVCAGFHLSNDYVKMVTETNNNPANFTVMNAPSCNAP